MKKNIYAIRCLYCDKIFKISAKDDGDFKIYDGHWQLDNLKIKCPYCKKESKWPDLVNFEYIPGETTLSSYS